MITAETILAELEMLGNPENLAGQQRFGIRNTTGFGIKVPVLRAYAKPLKNQHQLALQLWQTGVHEARLLAAFIADPKQMTETDLEQWVRDFNSWDICDQVCMGLVPKMPLAFAKAREWANREPEFEKRAGFATLAALAVHAKKVPDEQFLLFLDLIKEHAADNRNFVKKAVNWALRQIGKRSPMLKEAAIHAAEDIKCLSAPSARWIASDALRELQKDKPAR